MHNTSSPFPVAAFLAVTAVLGGALAFSRLKATPAIPVTVIAGLDASASVRVKNAQGGTQLGQSRAALARLGAGLQAGSDRLVVARVDRGVREFYAGQAPSGSEKFLRLLMKQTETPAAQSGTFPARFWTLAAARAADVQSAPGRAVAVVYYGDADNDDLSPAARAQIALAAQQLARNPRVTGVWIFGAKPDNWETLRGLFAPLRAKLHLAPREEMAPAPLLERLDEARRGAK